MVSKRVEREVYLIGLPLSTPRLAQASYAVRAHGDSVDQSSNRASPHCCFPSNRQQGRDTFCMLATRDARVARIFDRSALFY